MHDMSPEDTNHLNQRFDELLDRLAEQDKLALERGEAQYKVAQHLKEQYENLNLSVTEIKLKVDPMYKIFADMNGFSKVTIQVLKFLGLLGAATTAFLIIRRIFIND